MNVLSLFAGIGGIDLGLERAGIAIVGQVELDPFCRQILAHHWPEVPKHDDVRTAVEWWRVENRPAVDLVTGGFPCQTVSTAGRRRGQADERWLWPAMAAVVRALRPRWVLVENVPGLLVPVAVRDDAGGVAGHVRAPVEDVLGDLAASGYDAEWDCVPAAAVGAPHRRDRVFIIAHTNSHEHQGSPSAVRWSPSAVVPADADGCGLAEHPERHGEPVARFEPSLRSDVGGLREDVADIGGEGLQGSRHAGQASRRPRMVFSDGRSTRRSWWAAEPDVGRVAHGVPARVDRLRALGNAVVPHVAEHIGRLILATERERGAA